MSRPPRSDATSAGLRYVAPDALSIIRQRSGRGFRYLGPGGRPIRSAREIARIRAIAIPPAWTDVRICPYPDGHLLAVGRDARGRLQYRYHPRFRSRRDDGKFDRLVRFGQALPRIRRRVRQDLARRGLPREKVLAAVVSLLETTRFRVGNDEYARLNRSFGITTLHDRHATATTTSVRFRFRGKGGRTEERTLVDRRLAAIVTRCQDLPGQSLFQFVDADGEEQPVTSGDVNDYLREASGSDEFTAKDFRTWMATVVAYRALRGAAPVKEAIRRTAVELNNTVTVTRNSYVHPAVLDAFAPGDDLALGDADAKGRVNGADRAGRDEDDGRPIKRRDELAVLAILRSSARPSPATATRSQVARRRVRQPPRRPAA